MSKGLKLIVFTVVILIVFINFYMSLDIYKKRIIIENKLNLASMILNIAVSAKTVNSNDVSQGYVNKEYYEDNIEIDKKLLIKRFYEVIDNQTHNKVIRKNIVTINLIKDDIIYTYDPYLKKWLAPEFFIYNNGNRNIYLSAYDDDCYTYNAVGNKVYSKINDFSIDDEIKQDVVINKVNEIIGKYTKNKDPFTTFGVKVKNTSETVGEDIYNYSFFNNIDDITLFVVYEDLKRFSFGNFANNFFSNYKVAGYTLSY